MTTHILRNSLAALSVAALLGSGATSAAPSPSPGAPADVEVENALRATSVKYKLIEKLGTDALRIHVAVAGDKATLSGTVEKKATQEIAKEVALSVKGIASVDNQLQEKTGEGVLPAAKNEVADVLLESKVKNILLTEIGTNALKIEIEATDGVVSLRGTLPNADLVKSAIAKARAIKGVKKVVNLLNG